MIGISYYAMAQLAAATERPPHLKAVFPLHLTTAMYDAVRHNGLYSAGVRDVVAIDTRASPLAATGFSATRSIRLLRRVLLLPAVHTTLRHVQRRGRAQRG